MTETWGSGSLESPVYVHQQSILLISICRETPFLFHKTCRCCPVQSFQGLWKTLAPCICITTVVHVPCLSLYLMRGATGLVSSPVLYITCSPPKQWWIRFHFPSPSVHLDFWLKTFLSISSTISGCLTQILWLSLGCWPFCVIGKAAYHCSVPSLVAFRNLAFHHES